MSDNGVTPFGIQEAGRWLQRDFVMECANLLESQSVSLREAAYRGDDNMIIVTLKQMRLTLVEAIGVAKEIAAGSETIPPAPAQHEEDVAA